MKKFAVIAVVAMIGISVALAAKGDKKNKNTTTTPPYVPPPAAASSIPTELKGTVVKVDGPEVTVTVKVPVDIGTRIVVNGETKSLSDLKEGAAVTITLDRGSTTKIETGTASGAASQPASAPK